MLFILIKFYIKSSNFIFALQPIEINLCINLVYIGNANICILGLTKSRLYSFLLLVENELKYIILNYFYHKHTFFVAKA